VARPLKIPVDRGSIIVISAPSGAGKSTLTRRLVAADRNVRFSISYTTRSPRAGEKNGRDYFFVNSEEFKRMIAAGEFVEWADVFGNLYGTSWKKLQAAQEQGKDVLLDIDVQGHRQVRERLPEAVSVFVLPPSFRELERRLRHRHSDSPKVIAERLVAARAEVAHWPEYDYLVVNGRLPRALRALMAVVRASRHRRVNQAKTAQKVCETVGG